MEKNTVRKQIIIHMVKTSLLEWGSLKEKPGAGNVGYCGESGDTPKAEGLRKVYCNNEALSNLNKTQSMY